MRFEFSFPNSLNYMNGLKLQFNMSVILLYMLATVSVRHHLYNRGKEWSPHNSIVFWNGRSWKQQ
jgi:hypothetical protein